MSTYERVRRIVAEIMDCKEEQISPETSLAYELVADSLEDVEITMALEQEFGIEFKDDAGPLNTIQQIVDYIEAALSKKQVSATAPPVSVGTGNAR